MGSSEYGTLARTWSYFNFDGENAMSAARVEQKNLSDDEQIMWDELRIMKNQYYGGLADDQTVLDQATHLVARVGVGDVGVLVRVQPHLSFATLHGSGGEPLLEDERAHCVRAIKLLDNRNRTQKWDESH